MKTTWFQNNLAELARALHFGHKSADENHLSLLEDNCAYQEQNFVLGQEFESLSQKGPVIESGIYMYIYIHKHSEQSTLTKTELQHYRTCGWCLRSYTGGELCKSATYKYSVYI